MSIIVENLTKIYGKQKALDNVSFEINSGEIEGLIGPNGAGKSTMMKIITCYLPPSSGKVTVCSFDVEENSLEARKKTGYLPEHNPLYLDLYVCEYLEFVAGIYKLGNNSKKRINEMNEITGLEYEVNKKIGALSKGYRQRVGLAQALIHDPDVIILDEPTSGLDPNQIIEIRNLIKKIGKSKTVLFSTHIMQGVEAICDKVIIIDKGKIIANSSKADLHNFDRNYICVFVEFDNDVAKKQICEIPGIIDAEKISDNKWNIRSSSEIDIRPDIFKFAVKNNIAVLSMKIEEQSLEKTFHELTKK